MSALTDQELQELLDRVMQDITNRMAQIRRCRQETALSGDVCTVSTTFEGDYHATLTLYADTALLARLTRCVLQEETVGPQDIEDFTKEYFNVICGNIVAKLFQAAHLSSRFRIPSFSTGRHVPAQPGGPRCVLNYTSSCNEGAQLIHEIPSACPRGGH